MLSKVFLNYDINLILITDWFDEQFLQKNKKLVPNNIININDFLSIFGI